MIKNTMFTFTDCLGEVQSFDPDKVMGIHSPVKDSTASLIEIIPAEGGRRYEGVFTSVPELVEQFNKLSPDDPLIYWKFNDYIKHNATKRSVLDTFITAYIAAHGKVPDTAI